MKKIFLAFMSLMFIICLVGCSDSKQFEESKISEELNIGLEQYFETNNSLKDGEIRDKIYINDLIVNYKLFNKYLIFIDYEHKSKYYCAYLDSKVKEILDTIEIITPDGEPNWYLWQGENLYLKKYEYAIENDIINYNDYSLKWFEFEEKEDILDSYENLFLVSITKSQMLNVINYENSEKIKKLIFIEENSYNFNCLIEEGKRFYLLTEKEINVTSITLLDIYEFLMYNSFEYKILNEKIYIKDNTYKLNMDYVLMDYMIIDDCYFYCLDEIIKYIKE